jgi:hypothetical protein
MRIHFQSKNIFKISLLSAAALYSCCAFSQSQLYNFIWSSGDYINSTDLYYSLNLPDPIAIFGQSQNSGLGTLTNNASIASEGSVIKLSSSAAGIINNGYLAALDSVATIVFDAPGGTLGLLLNESGGRIDASAYNDYQNITSGTTHAIYNAGTIIELTNLGVLGYGSEYAAILNTGQITTLNNIGGVTYALTLQGNLPVNYRMISPSSRQYGQLVAYNATGVMNFGIHTSSSLFAGTYWGVLQGISASKLDPTSMSGWFGDLRWKLVNSANGPLQWNLVVTSGPTVPDTHVSLSQAAAALRSVFNQQSAVINNSLNYDCTVFSQNGWCVSGGGRFATSDSTTGERGSTLLVTSYKATKNVRVGGFVDQNPSRSNITGISVNKAPMYGVFGVWNQNPDLMGYEVRLATNWSNQNITQTRNVFDTAEAGMGTASLGSQAISGVVSYTMPVTDSTWMASLYAGLRNTKVVRGSYSETESTDVTTPLTYSPLSQRITTALAGVRMNKKISDSLRVSGSVGVEQNVGAGIDTLNASGLDGLGVTDFSANYAKTRPVASVSGSYAPTKDQRISLNLTYRKEAFQSTGSTTAFLMYQIGL